MKVEMFSIIITLLLTGNVQGFGVSGSIELIGNETDEILIICEEGSTVLIKDNFNEDILDYRKDPFKCQGKFFESFKAENGYNATGNLYIYGMNAKDPCNKGVVLDMVMTDVTVNTGNKKVNNINLTSPSLKEFGIVCETPTPEPTEKVTVKATIEVTESPEPINKQEDSNKEESYCFEAFGYCYCFF